MASDGRLYLASEDGDVFVLPAGRDYVELGKNPMGQVIMGDWTVARVTRLEEQPAIHRQVIAPT